MRTVEISLDRLEAAALMQEMRLWLDAQRIGPSQFTATEAGGYLVVRTEFQVDAEAEAFADRFAGRMSSN